MAKYVTTEQYFDLIHKVMDDSWLDNKAHHPDDIRYAIEYACQAVGVVLESLDQPGEG